MDLAPKNHPNAAVASGSSGAGILLVWLLNKYAGADLDPIISGVIIGGITTLTLAIGRHGLRGIIRTVWRGHGSS